MHRDHVRVTLSAVLGAALVMTTTFFAGDAATASPVVTNLQTAGLVADICPGSGASMVDGFVDAGSAELDGHLYFSAGCAPDRELWRTNGETTERVADINPGTSAGSTPTSFAVLGGWVYFSADSASAGRELWRSNGTTTELVADVRPGAIGSFPDGLYAASSGWVYFAAHGIESGIEVWRSNGTTTHEVADIRVGGADSDPAEFVELGGWVYFSASDGTHGRELWRTNGTTTELVFDINPTALASSNPFGLTPFDGSLYFTADDGVSGEELWRTDGITTERVFDIYPGASSSQPRELTAYNSQLYFTAAQDSFGRELWRTDGTTTALAVDIHPTTGSSPAELTVVGTHLVFRANDGTHGVELWRSNGAIATLIADINPGAGDSFPLNLTRVGSIIYFSAQSPGVGRELWSTDGLTAQLIRDIPPADSTSNPIPVGSIGSTLLFSADDSAAGRELWRAGFTTTTRISGADRFATAIAVSQQSHPADGSASVVYIAFGGNYPDALAAGPAAALDGAPVLLTPATSLPTDVRNEVQRLDPDVIVIVGGTGVVSAAVQSALAAAVPGADVQRRSGIDRYATARSIVEEAFTSPVETVYIATGRNFPDALSAGAAGGSSGSPVILVDGLASSIPAATITLIENLDPDVIKIAGGTGVVSAAIQTQLSEIATTTRLAGPDRYATSLAINNDYYSADYPRAFLATGVNFPDALAGAPFAGSVDAPLFVVPGSCAPGATHDALRNSGVQTVTLLGGTGVLTASVASLARCT